MSAALAAEVVEFEQFNDALFLHVAQEPAELRAIAIPEMPGDQLVRARAARFAGNCIANQEVAVEYLPKSPINSLFEALPLAAEGDLAARSMIRTNVLTDVSERTLKSGHVTEVELTVDERGLVHQDGHSLESIQANNILFTSHSPQMQERVDAEVNNVFRLSNELRAGRLEQNSFVVMSRAADNMSLDKMREIGFFTDTMSVSIQVIRKDGDKLLMETAFVAGAVRPGEERHDAQTIAAIGNRLGVDLRNKSAAELIDTPLLIPNKLIPHGVIDIVELYDASASEEVFFGEAKPSQDYQAYRRKCIEKETQFKPLVEKITDQLIDEAATIHNPVEATQRLAKLSGQAMVQQAMFDYDIMPEVFGTHAAEYITAGRLQFEQGNYEAGMRLTLEAKRVEKSSSCPNGGGSSVVGEQGSSESSSKESESGDCEFVSKECPKCGAKNVHTTVSRGVIKGRCGCRAKIK